MFFFIAASTRFEGLTQCGIGTHVPGMAIRVRGEVRSERTVEVAPLERPPSLTRYLWCVDSE